MKYPWLYVGAKVACVDDAPRGHRRGALRKGAVYTIAEVVTSRLYGIGIQLREIESVTGNGFYIDRFRPVLPDTTAQVTALSKLVRDAMRGKVDA